MHERSKFKTHMKRRIIFVTIIFVAYLFGGFAFAQDQASISALRQMGKAFASIAEKTSPAVVGIKADKVYIQQYSGMPYWFFEDPFFDDDFFEHFFGRPRQRKRQQQPQQRKTLRPVQGSGFIISEDGYILTNNHLVGEAENVRVQLNDEREFEAKVIGTDPESDVALVKIDQKGLPHLELANSDTLEVGEWVIAIGNPFGLSHTVTAGIVSAKGRSNVGITTYEDFIQTDAAINPGNSGGPLLNLDGKVVGINTAIVSRSGGNMGIGLAIPVNLAKAIYEQLISEGKVVRGYLGIALQDISPELAENFELKDSKGVIITEVVEDSAADKAGLKLEDIVVEFNGKRVEDRADLMRRVAMLPPGTKVEMVILRDGKKKDITAELGERPKQEEKIDEAPATVYDLGLKVENLSDELMERLGYKDLEGVVVAEVSRGSVAQREGIEPGMLIMKVNRTAVSNVREFYKEIEKVKKGETVVLLVTDGKYRRFVPLRVPEEE